MKATVGGSAGVLALLAFVIHLVFPGAPGSDGAASRVAGVAQAASEDKASKGDKDEAAAKGPWLATRKFFGAPPPDGPVTGSRDDFGVPLDQPVQLVLATIPDPSHTRLGLFTDSSLQAIQRGAAAASWEFATQWMPWKDSAPKNSEGEDAKSATRGRVAQEPGVLVFRHQSGHTFGPGILMVFLVGETPTAGVDPYAFQRARSYMRALSSDPLVRVLGPSFSGSYYSLSNLIKADRKDKDQYIVRTGTASSYADEEAFRQSLQPTDEFSLLRESTKDQSDHLGDTLHQLGIPLANAAILAEDESGFGRAVADVREKGSEIGDIRVFRFPREIAHLRNAYAEAVQAGKSGQTNAAPDINFSLKESDSGEDSVPTFSHTQTPLSQDAVLNEITNGIIREKIQLVEITGTNVLDVLFLARVLRRQCPDTRILVLNPDLLFVEAAHSDPLSGMLAISSYPLFSQSNLWVGPGQLAYPTTHSDSNSEGVFNAMVLLLLGSQGYAKLNDNNVLSSGHPAGWLLTLDRVGFLPMRIWRQSSNGERLKVTRIDPPRTWAFLSVTIAATSIGLVCWIVFLRFNQSHRVDARLSIDRDEPADQWREVYLLAIALILASAQAMVDFPEWSSDYYTQPGLSHLFGMSGVVLNILFALYILWDLRKLRTQLITSLVLVAGAVMLTSLWLRIASGGLSMFSFRAVELRFGSSPEWPILASAFGVLLFAFVHLTRLYLHAYQEPGVVTERIYLAIQPRLRDSVAHFNCAAGSVAGFCKWNQLTLPALVFVGLLALATIFRLGMNLRTMEGKSYDLLLMSLNGILTAALLLTSWHIMELWSYFQSFLASLGSLPLAYSFIPLHRTGGNRPVWVRRFNVQSLTAHVHAAVMLHDLALSYEKEGRHALANQMRSEAGRYRAQISKLVNPQEHGRLKTREDVRKQFLELRALSKSIATWLFDFVIKPNWNEQPLEPTLREKTEKEDGAPRSEVELAQTFVALHFSAFLVYGVRQIRNLMWFLPAGFALLVFSTNSSSIQSPRLIGRLLIVLFGYLAWVLWMCGAGLERSPILSRIAGTNAGELNKEFYFKLAGFATVPVLGLLSSEFPSISNFLFSWVAPTLQAFR